MDWKKLKEMAQTEKGQITIVSVVFALVAAAGLALSREQIAQVVSTIMGLFN